MAGSLYSFVKLPDLTVGVSLDSSAKPRRSPGRLSLHGLAPVASRRRRVKRNFFLVARLCLGSLGLLVFPRDIHAETFVCDKEVTAYDLQNPPKPIGKFQAETILEVDREKAHDGFVPVSWKGPQGEDINALCAEADVKPLPLKIKEGSYTLASKIPGDPKVQARYRIPLSAKGKPGPNAHNVVFYAPFFSDNEIRHKEWAEKMGYTIFTLLLHPKMEDVEDRKKFYCYPESGSFELVFETQKRLTEEYGLKPRKLLLAGRSAGGSMAEQLASSHPDLIEAVALNGGGHYDPLQTRLNIPWCVFVTRGDTRIPANEELVQKGRSLGMNMLYALTAPHWVERETPNFLHSPDDFSLSVLEAWLTGVIRIREANGGKLDADLWPLLASAKEPRTVMANTPENQAKIPPTERLFFPSQEFVEGWLKIPTLAEPFAFSTPEGSQTGFLTRPLGPPKGLVLFHQTWNEGSRDETLENLYYFSEKGFIAMDIPFTNNGLDGLKETREWVKWTLAQESFQGLPIYLAGFGMGGNLAALNACSNPRIKAAAAIGAPPEWPFEELSLKDQMGKLGYPLRLVYGEDDPMAKTEWIEAAEKMAAVEKAQNKSVEVVTVKGVGRDLGNEWFPTFDQAVNFFERCAKE